MTNAGNTCFVNSIAQVLQALPGIRARVVDLASMAPAVDGQKSVLSQTASLLESMQAAGGDHVVVPSALNDLVKEKNVAIAHKVLADARREGKEADAWIKDSRLMVLKDQGRRQEDAHELLVLLLEILDAQGAEAAAAAGGQRFKMPVDPDASPFAAWVHAKLWDEQCERPVSQDITFYIATFGKCGTPSCPHLAEFSMEGHQVLSLQLPTDARDRVLPDASLMGMLREYFAKEVVEEYKCFKCDRMTTLTKYLRLVSSSEAVVVQLARFRFGIRGGRLDLPEGFVLPEVIDLAPVTLFRNTPSRPCDGGEVHAPLKYELVALVCHHSQVATNGHYTAHVRMDVYCLQLEHEAVDLARAAWMSFDDTSVCRTTFQALPVHDAYLLVYRRMTGP